MSKNTGHTKKYEDIKKPFKIFCMEKDMTLHEGLAKAMSMFMKHYKPAPVKTGE